MIIYNTTFHVEATDAKNFVIYLHEVYIPSAEKSGILSNPRLTRILSHKEDDSECFSLQFEIEDTAKLHKWYSESGSKLNDDMLKTFAPIALSCEDKLYTPFGGNEGDGINLACWVGGAPQKNRPSARH